MLKLEASMVRKQEVKRSSASISFCSSPVTASLLASSFILFPEESRAAKGLEKIAFCIATRCNSCCLPD